MITLCLKSTITRPNETFRQLIYRIYGQQCSEREVRIRMQAMIDDNRHSIYKNILSNWPDVDKAPYLADVFLKSNQAISVPLVDGDGGCTIQYCTDFLKQQHHHKLKLYNAQPWHVRNTIRQMEEAGISLIHLVNALTVTQIIAQHKTASGFSMGLANSLMEHYKDYRLEGVEEFVHKLNKVDKAARALAATKSARNPVLSQQLNSALLDVRRSFDSFLRKVADVGASKPGIAFRRRKILSMAKAAAKSGSEWSYMDVPAIQRLISYVPRAKWITRGCVAFDIAMIGVSVGVAAHDGEDWLEELVSGLAGFAGGILGGWIATRSLKFILPYFVEAGPPGWALIVGGAIAFSGFDFVAEYYSKKGYRHFSESKSNE